MQARITPPPLSGRHARYAAIQADWRAFKDRARADKDADAERQANRVLDEIYVARSWLRNRDSELRRLRAAIRRVVA